MIVHQGNAYHITYEKHIKLTDCLRSSSPAVYLEAGLLASMPSKIIPRSVKPVSNAGTSGHIRQVTTSYRLIIDDFIIGKELGLAA